MGLFGGGDDNQPDDSANNALNQQIAQNQQELEAKRQNLYSQRLDVIKSTGGQQWKAEPVSGNSSGGNSRPSGFPFNIPPIIF